MGVVNQLDDFVRRSVFEPFAAVLEGFGDTDGDILHLRVGFLGAAHEEKLFAACDAFVLIVVVESNTQKADDFGLGLSLARHRIPFFYGARWQRAVSERHVANVPHKTHSLLNYTPTFRMRSSPHACHHAARSTWQTGLPKAGAFPFLRKS